MEEKKIFRIHRNLVEAIAESLKRIFFEGEYADDVVERLLKSNPKWGSRDRHYLASAVYDITRYWRRFTFLFGKDIPQEREALIKVWGLYLLTLGHPLPEWKEMEGLREIFEERSALLELQPLRIRESISDELDELGAESLGATWEKEIKALNQQAPLYIRVNRLETNRNLLKKELEAEGIACEPVEGTEDALRILVRRKLSTLSSFQEGYFEIQDPGSQQIGVFTKVKPGMTVIDACAGAGGKTLHLAALMRNEGELIATDLFPVRLRELKSRAERAGAEIIRIETISDDFFRNYSGKADVVLLDAPCTGSGVLRREPDKKYRINRRYLHEMQKKQAEVLETYRTLVKPGGELIYSTCSVFKGENIEQVSSFLVRHPEFNLTEEKSLLPSQTGSDGYFMARLHRRK